MIRALRKDFEKSVAYLILGATMLLMFSVIAEAFFKHGYLGNWDAEFYALSGQYWAKNLLPHGHVAGWFPLWLGGFDYYVMYPPLSAFILGLMSLVMGTELPTRTFSAALWIGMVPAMYTCLRSFRVDRLSAAVGASLMVAIDVVLSAGYIAMFKIGFLPQGFGFLWSMVILGRFSRDFETGDFQPKRSVRTGLFVAGVILSHHFSALWLGIASTLLLAVECVYSPTWVAKVRTFVLTYVVGFALSSFWWVPLIAKRKMMVDVTPVFARLDMAEQVSDLLKAFTPLMLLLAALGVWRLIEVKRWRFLAFVGLVIAYSAIQSLGLVPFPIDVISPIQARRFEVYFEWSFLLLVPFGFQAIREIFKRRASDTMAVLVVLVLLVINQVGISRLRLAPFAPERIILQNKATDQIAALAHELQVRIKPGEMNLSEASEFTSMQPTYGGPHLLHENLVRMVPGLWDLAGGYPEAILGAEHPFWLSRRLVINLGRNEAYIRRRGVRYVSTMLTGTSAALSNTIPWLKKVWSPHPDNGDLDTVALFEVVGFNTPFGLTPELSAHLRSFDYSPPGRYHLVFSEPVAVPAGTTFAVNYDAWLRLRMDGVQVPTVMSPEKILAVGKSVEKTTDISISYEAPWWVGVVRYLALFMWVGAIAYLFRRRK